MIRVLLLDDHAAFRQPLGFMLERDPNVEVVASVGTLAEARNHRDGIDVAVVDLELPDGNGVELIPELVQANPRVAVLVLTASIDRSEIAACLEAGAVGVVHKSAGIAEIIIAVQKVARGEHLHSAREVVELLRFAASERGDKQEVQQRLARLTPREYEVLQLLAEGLSDKEIAARLVVSSETVRTHMVNILGKLEVRSRLQAVVVAARHGAVQI